MYKRVCVNAMLDYIRPFNCLRLSENTSLCEQTHTMY